MNLEKEIFDIELSDIMPNRFQPREIFDDEALKELAESIKIHGVIQPIIVRKVGDKYEIIAGERRYRASNLAGKETIPALVRDIDDKEAAKIALLENLQRKDLTPIEEAKTYQTILKLDNITQDELAQNLGKSQSAIANKLRLLNLSEEVQTALLNNQISERHARSLLTLDNQNQKNILNRIINERLTVRQVDSEIMKLTGKMPEGEQEEDFIENDQIVSQATMNSNNTESTVEQNNVSATPIINPEQSMVLPIENTETSNIDKTPEIVIEQPQIENEAMTKEELPKYEEKILPNIELASSTQPQENIVSEELPKHENNIFDKLRVTSNQNLEQQNNIDEPLVQQPLNETNVETPIITSPIEQTSQPEYNNIYDLRFAINNFRQAIQNTEKFGFKVTAEEYDNQDSYQIVIKIDKNN